MQKMQISRICSIKNTFNVSFVSIFLQIFILDIFYSSVFITDLYSLSPTLPTSNFLPLHTESVYYTKPVKPFLKAVDTRCPNHFLQQTIPQIYYSYRVEVGLQLTFGNSSFVASNYFLWFPFLWIDDFLVAAYDQPCTVHLNSCRYR